jgi:UDP-N-acetylmuramate dehydrogenase
MLEIQKNIPLAPWTSWLVGGPAEFFALPTTVAEIVEAQQWARNQKVPVTVLGGGSNVLISDEGIEGLTICLKKLSGIEISRQDGQFKITALGGTSKSELLKAFLKAKLAPALFLAGLPGDVGGGVVMNAGVSENFQPREFVEIVEWIEVLRPNGTFERVNAQSMQWRYRHCEGWQPGIITRVGISWPDKEDASILEQVKSANKARLSKQPLDMPSCGSVFVNPVGHKAAQLIDSSGLKGFSVGGAQVSMKHANFIVNTGRATAKDIWQVIGHVRQTVLEQKNVALITEVIRLGKWASD